MYGRIGENGYNSMPVTSVMLTADGVRQSVYDQQNAAAATAMQTVRPDAGPLECPPCPPPQVIYRDRIVEKIVDRPVPGPVRYVDRYIYRTALPGGGWSNVEAGGFPGGGTLPSAAFTPEPGFSPDAAAGTAALSTKRFPWWLLLVAAGAIYVAARRRKDQ